MATKSSGTNKKATSNATAKAGNTASVTGGMGKGTGKRVPPATTPAINHGGRGQRSTVGESIPVIPRLGAVRQGDAAWIDARSKKLHEVIVGNWVITKKWVSGKQASVTLSEKKTGKVVREEIKSTAEINAIFSFGDKVARLGRVRDELNDEKSVAVKAGESIAHIEKKITANDAKYASLLLDAELAGILTVLPELKPRSRKRHAATVAPTI